MTRPASYIGWFMRGNNSLIKHMENNSIQSSSTKSQRSKAGWTLLAMALEMLGAVAYYFSAKKDNLPLGQETTLSEGSAGEMKIIFGNPKKSAHYESNTP